MLFAFCSICFSESGRIVGYVSKFGSCFFGVCDADIGAIAAVVISSRRCGHHRLVVGGLFAAIIISHINVVDVQSP